MFTSEQPPSYQVAEHDHSSSGARPFSRLKLTSVVLSARVGALCRPAVRSCTGATDRYPCQVSGDCLAERRIFTELRESKVSICVGLARDVGLANCRERRFSGLIQIAGR